MSRHLTGGLALVTTICILSILVGCSQDTQWQTQFDAVKTGESSSIQLIDRPITPSQLASLVKVKEKLFDVLIDGGGLTDAGMAGLGKLAHLEHLRVRKSPISDHGLQLLAKGQLDSLRVLNLPHSVVTQRGITHLHAFANLTNLRLGGRQLDDEAVREIAALPSLRSLHLIGPNISGQSLDYLAQAPKLASFYIDDCELPDDAWVRLFNAKPKLHVHINQHHHDRDPDKDH